MTNQKPVFGNLQRLAALAGCLLVAACRGGADKTTAELPASRLAALGGTWLLVPETSHHDTLAYRRNTYRFRYRPGGRPGFRLGPGGRFTRYDVAPGGGLVAQEGTWAETSPGRLRIRLPELEPAEPDYELEILAYQTDVLTLRRRTP